MGWLPVGQAAAGMEGGASPFPTQTVGLEEPDLIPTHLGRGPLKLCAAFREERAQGPRSPRRAALGL